MVFQMGLHREIETVGGIGLTMLAGIALVALSLQVMLPVTAHTDPVAREDIALALSVVLIGLLMMVTRRNAISQVVGFMSLENGINLAATGARGMPLVVEISVAFSILIAFIVVGVFLFRIRERFDTIDVGALDRSRGGQGMMPDPVAAILLTPLVAAAILAVLPGYRLGAALNVLASLVSLLFALTLLWDRPATGAYLLVDDLNIVFVLLNCFIGFTTSAFSASYIGHELETGRLTAWHLRFYHAMFQLMLFGMNLALLANNIGLMWVAVELATLTTVMMVGLYRTAEALEAAWKYFILGSVGIALALFGTILVYLAARPVVGEGLDAMIWTNLLHDAPEFDPSLLNIAFIFLLLGYGTKVGLAPLHAWLPDAHAEGPTPISAVLSGLLLNVALYALLRFKVLLAANPHAIAPGPLMIALGLLSLIFAAFMLYRRRDIKRLFAYSSIEHMGIIVFAFGMAGPLGNFAGLLQMTMHSLTKSAIFFSVGHITQVKGTQRIAGIGGLTESHPILGWGLVAGVVAIIGLPPFGVFTSEFLVVSSTFAQAADPGGAAGHRPAGGLRRAAAAPDGCGVRPGQGPDRPGPRRLHPDVRPPRAGAHRRHLAATPAGRVVPARRGAAGMTAPSILADLIEAGELVPAHQPWPRAWVDADIWQQAIRHLAEGTLTLLSLWAEPGYVHMALLAQELAVEFRPRRGRHPRSSRPALHRPRTHRCRTHRPRTLRPRTHHHPARHRGTHDRRSTHHYRADPRRTDHCQPRRSVRDPNCRPARCSTAHRPSARHNPHRHNPQRPNPPRHNPQRHNPHRHNPHRPNARYRLEHRRPQHRMPRQPLSLRRCQPPPGHPPGTRHPRPVRPPAGRPDRHPPLARSRPLVRGAGPRHHLPIPARARRGPAPDPGRTGPRRHHRARAFPLHLRRRNRRPAGRAPRLCPQGHRPADVRRPARPSRAPGWPGLRRQHRGLCPGLRPRGRRPPSVSNRRHARSGCAR